MPHSRREFLWRVAALAGGAAIGCAKPARAETSAALRAAAAFLAARQSPDGAWRSTKYGALREGDALTPLVLWALADVGVADLECVARGLRWLESRTAAQSARAEPWEGLGYPLFTASYAAQVFAHANDLRRAAFWADLVERLRISPAMGWPSAAAECGAWSDAPVPPQLPTGTWPPPDMLAPNISATLLGLHAMIAAGRRDRTAPALPFLALCQNFATGADAQFDDGGFFFADGDPVRNKAGVAGRDDGGHERYHSYGSATCDGVLALEACGVAPDDPRQRAAFAWLRKHAGGMRHSGVWASDRADEGESLRFYHAQAFSAVLALAAKSTALRSWAAEQRRALTAELLAGQSRDGSWAGACPHSFEDDPLIATAFAIHAVA